MPSLFHHITYVHRYAMRCSLPYAALHLACAVPSHAKSYYYRPDKCLSPLHPPVTAYKNMHALAAMLYLVPTNTLCFMPTHFVARKKSTTTTSTTALTTSILPATHLRRRSCSSPLLSLYVVYLNHLYSCLIACSFSTCYQSSHVGVCGWNADSGAI